MKDTLISRQPPLPWSRMDALQIFWGSNQLEQGARTTWESPAPLWGVTFHFALHQYPPSTRLRATPRKPSYTLRVSVDARQSVQI